MIQPIRGEIWTAVLSPTIGREQSGFRPIVIISVDEFNFSPAEMVAIAPISTIYRGIPFHLEVRPPEGGLEKTSYIKCDQIRTISKKRLRKKVGIVSQNTIVGIEERLKLFLGL